MSKREINSVFGERMKELRDRKRVSQDDVAKATGLSKGSIQRYEYGEVPTLKNINKLVEYYGCSKAWLIDGIGESFPGKDVHQPDPHSAMNNGRDAAPVGALRPSIRVSDALIMASRVLESGTTYADALYTNIVHFDRAVQAEGKAPPAIAGNEDVERLLREIRTAVRNLERGALAGLSFKDLIHFVGKSISLEDFLSILLEKAMAATGAQIGSILIKDRKTGEFRIAAYRSPEKGVMIDAQVDVEESLTRIILTKKESLLVENIETDPRTRRPNDPKYGSPSFLAMPILAGDEVDGIVNLASKESNKIFDRADEEILRQIIPEVSAVLNKSTIPDGHRSQ